MAFVTWLQHIIFLSQSIVPDLIKIVSQLFLHSCEIHNNNENISVKSDGVVGCSIVPRGGCLGYVVLKRTVAIQHLRLAKHKCERFLNFLSNSSN